jgi:hypothetical protein
MTLFDKSTVEKAIQVKYFVPCIKIKQLKSTVYALYSSKFHASSPSHTANKLCRYSMCLSLAMMDKYQYQVAIQLEVE